MFRLTRLTLLTLASLLTWRIFTLTPPSLDTGGGRTEVQALFEDLAQAKLLHTQPDASFALFEPDYALAAAWHGEPMDKMATALLADLYGSAAGNELRAQVNLWNRSRRVTAVRDNGGSQGISSISWHAYNCADGSLLDTKALVAESFGYVHQGRLRPGFGEWTAVGANSTCVEWRGRFVATKALPLEIWYVGQAIKNAQQDRLGAITSYAPPRRQHLPDCTTTGIPAEQAGAWHLNKSAWQPTKDHTWGLEVRLRVVPAWNPSLAPQGLQIGISKNCQPQWQDVQQAHGKILKANWRVDTADGVELLTDGATASSQAAALGLLPVVGYGPDDTHGLGSRLRFTQPGGHLALTIDSRIQNKARAALDAGIKRLPQPDWAAERRAALVLVRADGAILAAVGFPDIPDLKQITTWDLAAFSRVYPLNNPLAVRAWEGVDRHQAAGSTFKPITAMTGLVAASELPAISGMLSGLSPNSFQALTGLGLKDFKIDPYRRTTSANPNNSHPTIQNFHFEPLGKLLRKAGMAGSCPGQEPIKYDLSLASAVRESMNIWFVALAMQMDGAAADSYQTDSRPISQRTIPKLRLIDTLHKFGFGATQPLFVNPPQTLSTWAMPKLVADQLDLLGTTPSPMRWILAQTSIGQGAFVTPLRMATMAASLATNTMVQPHLDAAWNGSTAIAPPPKPLGIDTTLLKRGMQAVVLAGTTHSAFLKAPPEIRCHTYAKTGTAQVARRDDPNSREPYGSAWTVGWHEPPNAKPAFAFACLVTHVQGTGGEICGPIVAELLQSISKQ